MEKLENLPKEELLKLLKEQEEKTEEVEVYDIEINEKKLIFPLRIAKTDLITGDKVSEKKEFVVVVSKELQIAYMKLIQSYGINIDISDFGNQDKTKNLETKLKNAKVYDDFVIKAVELLINNAEFSSILFASENEKVAIKIMEKITSEMANF
jgi:hypothetical protein